MFTELQQLWQEANRRTEVDGIPRRVTREGRIMKLDWELPSDFKDTLESEALEDHIARLLATASDESLSKE